MFRNLSKLKYLTKNKETTLNLNEITAYYLNGLRSKSTLLGVTNLRVPNQYVSRNILP